MLKIPIEIHPLGDSSRKTEIGSIKIINDGTHKNRPEYGNYKIELYSKDKFERIINVKNHKRDEGWLKLLHKATGELLKIAKKSKNKELQNT